MQSGLSWLSSWNCSQKKRPPRQKYEYDPHKDPQAKRFPSLTYIDALNRRLEVMDSTAISLCMDNHLPILVLNMWERGSLVRAISGEKIGTIISG